MYIKHLLKDSVSSECYHVETCDKAPGMFVCCAINEGVYVNGAQEET